jgi:hypothetical protein
MIPPRLKLVDGTLALLTAAVAGGGALEALLGVSVADDWAGFPEALPILQGSYAKNPNGHTWGSLFFVEPHARTLVGFGGSRRWFDVRSRIRSSVRSMRTHSDRPMRRRVCFEKSGFRKIGEANDRRMSTETVRVLLKQPSMRAARAFLDAVRRSRSLHGRWAHPPSTVEQYRSFVQRVASLRVA